MALHKIPASMLKESLDEYIEASAFCVQYKKTEVKFAPYNTGGCLGYPAGVLLFSTIDTLGSYFRGTKGFKVMIDSKMSSINGEGSEHFKILNSKYFDQKLSEKFIQQLYNSYRNKLTHNSVLGKNALMHPCNPNNNAAFHATNNSDGSVIYHIFIKELWQLCKNAVEEFKKDIDCIVPTSKQGKEFR